MPFTAAHPVLILPLARSKQFSATALIAGSMVPDFEFFFQMRAVENIGHHWYGIVLFDIPAALLLCYLFHNLLRNLLIAHLPSALQQRFTYARAFNWNTYVTKNKAMVFISLLTGIASHLAWDGFTHADGVFVEMLPALTLTTGWSFLNIPVYFLLQLLFSVMGMSIIMYTVYALPKTETETVYINSKYYWPLMICTISIILIIRIIVWPQYNGFGGLAIAAMGSITYGWILVSSFFNFYLLKNISI